MADLDGDATSARFETASDEAGECVLRVSGEVDLSNVALLREAIESFVASSPPRIVLDVGDLTFMDSSGLAALLQIAARVDAVVLRHPRKIIRRLIETTGVESILTMEP
jgi:anti-sigma B factor antagonist